MKKLTVLSNTFTAPAEGQNVAPSGDGGSGTSPEVQSSVVQRGSIFWRSLDEKARKMGEAPAGETAKEWREFPEGADVLEVKGGVSRRRFFGIMGSGAALAGLSSGCIRKPKEHILPFSERPEDYIPGKPMHYATAFQLGAGVEGVVVESHDGRPIKIEGNPKHGESFGGTGVFAQASILDVYDPDRTRAPVQGTERIEWTAAREAIEALLSKAEAGGGQGLALVIPYVVSPTDRALLKTFKERFPQARLFLDDIGASHQADVGAEILGGKGGRARNSLRGARVVVALDSDFLLNETGSTRLAREWAETRRVFGSNDAEKMSRLWVVEPHFTTTGQMADHRIRRKASAVGDVLIALAHELSGGGYPTFNAPEGVDFGALPKVELDEATQKFVKVMAKDLARPGKDEQGQATSWAQAGAILVGHRQPAWVHSLASLLGSALGHGDQRRPDQTLFWRLDSFAPETEPVDALAEAAGTFDTILCWGTNPVYDAPAVAPALEGKTVVHMGMFPDETAQVATYHIPVSHYLEAWGDLESADGTISIVQPLIQPILGTYSLTELLGWIATGSLAEGYNLVQSHWKKALGGQFSDRQWRTWLHDGVVTGAPREPAFPALTKWGDAIEAAKKGRVETTGLEVNFHLDPKVWDGRFSNNAWMQELPHPMTKLTWDNAAYLSLATAKSLGVDTGDTLTITVGGQSQTFPVWVAPGQADDTVSITLGYGRNWGAVAKDIGVQANVIRPTTSTWFVAGEASAAGGTHILASTQDYGSMKPPSKMGFEFPERPIALEATVREFVEDPSFVEKVNLMPASRLQHLWDPPAYVGKQQWGMSVDLNTCTGCNACVIACQAENNIPVVGKEQVLNGREMHWMRIDRYYKGEDADLPEAIVQPMLCQHCEEAPCETVCPVAATVHSPEGLNDMAYNRCIGTRYCSNNCPYKVRRYNFFNYNLNLRSGEFWTGDPTAARMRQMQKNPDVTVRFRGVMEKCTYCVQRINTAKIDAHVAGKDVVEDGVIQTACQQVCPTGSIVFGDIHDPDSKVSKAKRSPRDYAVLRDLNTNPRTTYLARIRNPHPDLA